MWRASRRHLTSGARVETTRLSGNSPLPDYVRIFSSPARITVQTPIIPTGIVGGMVDVEDVQGYRTKLANQQELLETAAIDEADREAIGRFVTHLRANDPDVESLGTVVGHLNHARLAAERSEVALTEMDCVEDASALKLHLEDEHGLAEGTARNYMKTVRKFYEWRGAEWAEDITIGASPERKHDPDDEITDDEFDAMLDACAGFDSATREKALIALLRDTALRIGAVLSLQLKHVDFEGDRATISINTDANVKDADGPKPVTWSRSYVANWLDVHPRPDNPEAALIHKTRQVGDDEHGALRQQYAGRRVQEIARVAGLDPERVHSHLFRGSAISTWIREGMSDQAIKHRADWSEDSRMFKVYSRVTDEELNDVVFDHYDIGDDEGQSGTPELEECPHCKTALRGGERFCPSCAGPLTQQAAEEADAVEESLADDMVDFETATKRGLARDGHSRVRDDEAFIERVVDRVVDRVGGGDGHDSPSSSTGSSS